jgi:hypothetical protein
LGQVVLAVGAEHRAVGVDDGGGVVVEAGRLDLEDGDDDDHFRLARHLLHAPHRRPVRHGFGPLVVLSVLHLAEVRGVEDLLEADDAGALPGRLACVLHMLLDHRVGVACPGRLHEGGAHNIGHEQLLCREVKAIRHA